MHSDGRGGRLQFIGLLRPCRGGLVRCCGFHGLRSKTRFTRGYMPSSLWDELSRVRWVRSGASGNAGRVGWFRIVKAQGSLDHATREFSAGCMGCSLPSPASCCARVCPPPEGEGCELAVLPPGHESRGEEDCEADGEDGGAGDQESAHAVGVGEVDGDVEGGEEGAEEHEEGGDQDPGFDGLAGALDGDDLVVGEADDDWVGGCAVVGVRGWGVWVYHKGISPQRHREHRGERCV